MSERNSLYAAKCFWPRVTTQEIERAAARAAAASARRPGAVTYLGAICFPDDELLLCLFAGGSPAAVRRAAEHAAIPCDRVMASVWIPNARTESEGARCTRT